MAQGTWLTPVKPSPELLFRDGTGAHQGRVQYAGASTQRILHPRVLLKPATSARKKQGVDWEMSPEVQAAILAKLGELQQLRTHLAKYPGL